MARPRSEDKRNALLAAATQVFADRGISAPTSAITGAAGLAEGTLFIYFKGKDDLINELYAQLKQDLAEAMLENYPAQASLRDRVKHIWNNYVEWGVSKADKLAVMHRIRVWEGLKPSVRAATSARFSELYEVIDTAITDGIFQTASTAFLMAMMHAQAETTMQFMRDDPAKSDLYRDNGFEMFWHGISQKP